MKKDNILTSLQERAQQQQLLQNIPFVKVFIFVSQSMGENPWKVIIPAACLLTFLLQLYFGKVFDESMLTLFGKI